MNFEAIYYEIFMNTYPSSAAAWVNVTSDVIRTTKCQIGMSDNGPLDRVASTGSLNFTLLNTDNKFTPGHPSRHYDLTSGCKVRLRFSYLGRTTTKFYGYIPPDGININSSPWLSTVVIQAVDYIEQLAGHEMELPAFATNKRMDEVAALIVANMHIAPLSTDYNAGQDTFPTVFDMVSSTTRALQEISKVTLSEMGYAYVRPKSTSDEVFVTEGRNKRNGQAYTQILLWDGVVSELLLESGDHLLLESGDNFLLESIFTAQDPFYTDMMRDMQVTHAGDYYNDVKTSVPPRRMDTPGEVLVRFEQPIQINAGATVKVTGRFVDPNQEAQSVSGINMQAPDTDNYAMNANAAGTGANMTAYLTVTVVYGVNGADYTLTNTHATTTGYVIRLEAQGTGVYTYRKVDHTESDTALVNAEGKQNLSYQMDYQNDPLIGTDFAVFLLSQYRNKLTTIEAATFVANRTPFLMGSFLELSIGDKIRVADTNAAIDRAYFINSLTFTVQPGGFVVYQLGLKDSVYDTFASWTLGTDSLNTTAILGY